MYLLVSSLLFLVHPFIIDKLLIPTNLYIRYQCSTRYSVNIIMTILEHHPRASHTPCLLGLILSHPNFFFFLMIIIYSSTKELILKYSISALKIEMLSSYLNLFKKRIWKTCYKDYILY